MKQLAALSLSLIVTVVGCDRPKAVVALDSRWNVDFAKRRVAKRIVGDKLTPH